MEKIKTFLKDMRISVRSLMVTVLLLVTIIPLSYAIFKNSRFGDSTIALASWSVTLNQTNEENHLTVIPEPSGTNASYTLNITNQSDVDIKYSIVIDGLPTGVSVAIGSSGSFAPEVNHKVTFPDVDTILHDAQNKTKSHTVVFKATSSASFVNNQEVDINVIAKQIVQNNS